MVHESGVTEGPSPPKPDADKATVLVVEDDPSLRRMICRHLEKMGLGVFDVDNGEAALAEMEAMRDEITA